MRLRVPTRGSGDAWRLRAASLAQDSKHCVAAFLSMETSAVLSADAERGVAVQASRRPTCGGVLSAHATPTRSAKMNIGRRSVAPDIAPTWHGACTNAGRDSPTPVGFPRTLRAR